MPSNQFCRLAALAAVGTLSTLPLVAQNLVWEDQALINAASLAQNSVFPYNGASVTTTWQQSGPGMSLFTGFDDYVFYRSGTQGNHFGYIGMASNNDAFDTSDFIRLTLTFSTPQTGVAFSILDIDTASWVDFVTLHYNGNSTLLSGTNVASNSSLWTYGNATPSITTATVAGAFGWRGANANAALTSTQGNVDVDLQGISVSRLDIVFRSGDGTGNPGAQIIGISDLIVVPEPASAGLALGAAGWFFSRRRKR